MTPPLSATCREALADALLVTPKIALTDKLAAALDRYRQATRMPRRDVIDTLRRVRRQSRELQRDLSIVADLGGRLARLPSWFWGVEAHALSRELTAGLDVLESRRALAEHRYNTRRKDAAIRSGATGLPSRRPPRARRAPHPDHPLRARSGGAGRRDHARRGGSYLEGTRSPQGRADNIRRALVAVGRRL